jgi:hypothetical protein
MAASTSDIPFPVSSMPGQHPGEGQGRLVNAFCEVDGGLNTWRPVPGLVQFVDTTLSTPRGMLAVEGVLYAAYEDTVVTVTENGVVTVLAGTLAGTEPVTWARNNKAGTPDVVVVSDLGAWTVTPTTVSAFADADLPSNPVSVSFLDGFMLFAIGDGSIYATGLNDVTVDALSFAKAESRPDGLIRGVTYGEQFYAFGPDTLEIWQNVGETPFPLQRATVVSVGLRGKWAIAGHEDGWDRELIFVASDGTVRRLSGATPEIVSTKDVERAIASVYDTSLLRACVYVEAGHPIWSLSAPTWTWEYNARTGYWHERQSYDQERWRGSTSCKFAGSWMVGDTLSGKLCRVSEAAYDELGEHLPMIIESGPVKDFPSRIRIPSAFFDWTTGAAPLVGTEDATEPKVWVSWSHDGGGIWSEPISARLLGGEGAFRQQVRVNRCGISTHHGTRWRLETSSPVYRTLRGGRQLSEARTAA